jgi:hypothetical protein
LGILVHQGKRVDMRLDKKQDMVLDKSVVGIQLDMSPNSVFDTPGLGEVFETSVSDKSC